MRFNVSDGITYGFSDPRNAPQRFPRGKERSKKRAADVKNPPKPVPYEEVTDFIRKVGAPWKAGASPRQPSQINVYERIAILVRR